MRWKQPVTCPPPRGDSLPPGGRETDMPRNWGYHRSRMRRRQAIFGAAAMGSALFGRDGWPDGSVGLWLGGDVQLGDGGARLEDLGWVIDGAVGIVNLEGPVSDVAPATDAERVVLWSAPRALEVLRAAGVRVAG